ncbi:hypothetical protein GRI40_02915 [Altererythrobacter aerius]|uniref:Uracil-DNA glycosylase-like domain-containing protein n=1 Tax=Tsuneonella aeria TaxID=1837929 RepID=A0A6I4TAN6_9SPHN|nr:hypothetical protein [Tsuneonella aeria]MXO74173.1 hypothetical protein [Tsuneonella aeria]
MPQPAQSPLASDIAAALDWWRTAGVDAAYRDTAEPWLAEKEEPAPAGPAPRSAAAAPPPPAPARVGGDRAQWPQTLDTFADWWLNEGSLDEGGLSPRVAPRGPLGAELMIVVPMPEDADRETLLSGPQGRLLGAFAVAAGLSADQVYYAAALPRHETLPDWAGLRAGGMGDVLGHHVALARPKRVLVLGQNILPLIGHDPAQGAQNLRTFNHEGGAVPALFEAGPERLLGNGKLRARLWRRWLEWTDGQKWDDG